MDDERFQQQAFETPEIGEYFDPNFIPQNGTEYLMKVIHERRQYPSISVKKPPTLNTKACTAIPIDTQEMDWSSESSAIALRPTAEWKSAQVDDFREVLKKVEKTRTEVKFEGPQVCFPARNEEKWEEFCRQHAPLLSIVLRLKAVQVELILRMISDCLRADAEKGIVGVHGVDSWLGSWTYSLLACLRIPLSPEVHSILRDIARTCIQLRDKLGENDVEKATPYNLFLVIITRVYDQLDFGEFV